MSEEKFPKIYEEEPEYAVEVLKVLFERAKLLRDAGSPVVELLGSSVKSFEGEKREGLDIGLQFGQVAMAKEVIGTVVAVQQSQHISPQDIIDN